MIPNRSPLFGGVLLLLLLLTHATFAGGTFQRTKDGKFLVWNDDPKPGDVASWSGERDTDGYATGPGTLTWSQGKRAIVTGSNIPAVTGGATVFGRYSGTMVRGKWDGPVTVDASGKIFHATFVSGSKSTDWEFGPAPTPRPKKSEHVHREAIVEASPPEPTPAIGERTGESIQASPAVEVAAQSNDTLRSLTAPPSSLRAGAGAEPTPRIFIPATQPSPSASPAVVPDDGKTVAALDARYQAAVKANDAATMDQILADDFVLVTGLGRVSAKADLLKEARGKQTVYEHQEEEEGTQKVRVWGDTAVVTARLWIKGTNEGRSLDYKLWFSDTYVRTPAGWRYAFGQASIPLPKADVK